MLRGCEAADVWPIVLHQSTDVTLPPMPKIVKDYQKMHSFASSLSTSAVQASIYGCFVIRSNLYFLSFLSSVRVCLLNANQLVYRCL